MTNQLWRPIEGFWEYKTEVAEVRRLTQYNGRTNGIGIRMTYLRGRGKGETEFGGELLPADVRLCEAVPLPAPDWAQAPEWAMWWAVDADGWAAWYKLEPVRGKYAWSCAGFYAKDYIDADRSVNLPLGIDWRTTLTERPQGEAHD